MSRALVRAAAFARDGDGSTSRAPLRRNLAGRGVRSLGRSFLPYAESVGFFRVRGCLTEASWRDASTREGFVARRRVRLCNVRLALTV